MSNLLNILDIWFLKNIFQKTFLNEPKLIFCTQLNGFTYKNSSIYFKQFYLKQFSLACQQISMVPGVAMNHLAFNLISVICLYTVKLSNSSISNNSVLHKYTVWMSNNSIRIIDRTLPCANTPAQSVTRSDRKEGLIYNARSWSITETSPSDCLILYPGYSLGKSYLPAEMQSV